MNSNTTSVFKANDIRGRYPEDLDESLYHRLGRAFGHLLGPASTAIVGGDVRTSTPSLIEALVSGLQEGGVNVISTGIAPTPVHYFTARHRPEVQGVFIVTASHNPPGDNGLKFMLHGKPTTPEQVAEIQKLTEKIPRPPSRKGTHVALDPHPAYERWILSRFGAAPHHRLKLVVDAGNGCWSLQAPRLLSLCGYHVLPLFCVPDGTYPNRRPDSAQPANLTALRRKVQEFRADLGVAFDGDGDRVAFVDATGHPLISDEAAALIAGILLPGVGDEAGEANAKLVYDLKMSRIILDIAGAHHAEALMERSGHAFIKARMLETGAVFGCEASGHFFYRELAGGDDALFTALLLADDLATSGDSLEQRRSTLPAHAITPDIRLRTDPALTNEILDALAGAFPPERVTRLDGVRVDDQQGWALARASITEPRMTFRFEGRDNDALRNIAEEFCAEAGPLGKELMERVRAFLEQPQ